MALFISAYGVNVPYWDEWELVPLLEKYNNGNLRLSDLWAQYAEHRLLFTKIIMIILADLSSWNVLYQMHVNLVLNCLIYLFLYRFLADSSQWLNKSFQLWGPVVFAWMVFSTVKWEHWLGSFSLGWSLNQLALFVAVWASTSWPETLPRWQGMLVGIGSAIIGAYSFGGGLFIWVVCVVIVFIREGLNKYSFIWVLSGLAITMLYFVDYSKPIDYPPLLFFIQHPYEYLVYIFEYLGGSFSTSQNAVIGSLLFVLLMTSIVYLASYHPKVFTQTLSWVAIALYVVFTAAAAGIWMVGFGVGQAAASRYTTLSTLFVLSTAVMVSIASTVYGRHHDQLDNVHLLAGWRRTTLFTMGVLARGQRSRLVMAAVGTLWMVLIISGYFRGLHQMREWHYSLTEGRQCLDNLDPATNECSKVIWADQRLRERANYLRKIRWAGFKPL